MVNTTSRTRVLSGKYKIDFKRHNKIFLQTAKSVLNTITNCVLRRTLAFVQFDDVDAYKLELFKQNAMKSLT